MVEEDRNDVKSPPNDDSDNMDIRQATVSFATLF